KKLLLSFCVVLITLNANAQNGFGDNFDDNELSCHWKNGFNYDSISDSPFNPYILTENNNMLRVDVDLKKAYESFGIGITRALAVDISTNPVLTVKIKSSQIFVLRVDITDSNQYATNTYPLQVNIPNT